MGKGGSANVEETAQEKAAAEIAMKRYQRYQEVYRPNVEDVAFADVTGDAAAAALERRAGGMASADNAKALDMAMKNMPSSGKPSVMGLEDQVEQSKAAAETSGRVAGLGDRQKMAGLQIATSIGTGQANDTQVSFDALAGDALKENISKQEATFNRRAARTNATMTGVGAVARAGMGMDWGKQKPVPDTYDLDAGNPLHQRSTW